MKILIAEDSADHRLLLQAYLKGSPHQVSFVGDGKEAVERFSAEPFDLVLMDIQLPVMDGISATLAMRSVEHQRGATPVCIVGLTANTRPQDIEASAKAGCNLHLSKPISKYKLLSAIEAFGLGNSSVDGKQTEPVSSISVKIPFGLEEIVRGYLAARRDELPILRASLAACNFEKLSVLSHNMKGTGTAYGFHTLTLFGAELEHAARARDTPAFARQLKELQDYLGRVQLCPAL
jgi:CheY-like chemotaxis protein